VRLTGAIQYHSVREGLPILNRIIHHKNLKIKRVSGSFKGVLVHLRSLETSRIDEGQRMGFIKQEELTDLELPTNKNTLKL
jgi:hypothetical protein